MSGNNDLKEQFERFDPSMKQKNIQSYLESFYIEKELSLVLDELYRWSDKTGYIDLEGLKKNKRYNYPDPDSGVTFRAQVNYLRDSYTPAPPDPSLHCPICFENIGTPGREKLRVFIFSLKDREFFIQLTPFPLFERHFVLITREPVPMEMGIENVSELVEFLRKAPGYTCCSNSDVEWAGASILVHHHYQIIKGLSLPIMEANLIAEYSGEKTGASFALLDYPMATCMVRAAESERLIETAGSIIGTWKDADPGRNTCNLIVVKDDDYRAYIMFRNPDYRTPTALTDIKSEGVGIIEAAGEGIYPVPSGPKEPELWARIENDGLNVIKGIIGGNNPVPRNEFDGLFKLISGAAGNIAV